ncbi:uncharacterized protein LOC124288277 [Haliotis rubra]|uniref:uncharacterized protein LOC124288277 n=1 Tax=Haliotis rubra TaxID=36100 RepID=UPI001EE5701C|nr:uncharacterized protein LOC124288277 [Haliotis rubra]
MRSPLGVRSPSFVTGPHGMMASSLNMLQFMVVLALVAMVTGEFTFVCPQLPSTTGPDLPQLPTQYEMRVEANIVQSQQTIEVLESYDFESKQVALTITRNGQATKSIHNFNTQERYDILANETCITTSINNGSENFNVFGFTLRGTDGKIHMASVSDVFKFSKKYNVSYVGETMVRGIPVNQWTSCQVSPELHSTFRLDYYFSRPGYKSASGNEIIPIRFDINGQGSGSWWGEILTEKVSSTTCLSASGEFQGNQLDNVATSGIHNFSHVYEFSVFKPGPIKDMSVFETPRGVVCTGRKSSVPLPKLVDQFTLDVEVDSGNQTPPQNMKAYFDYNFKMLRFDRFYSKDDRHQYGAGLITKIEDYKTGLEYVIDRAEGNCTIQKMPEKIWRTVVGDPHNITMMHAQELLKLKDKSFVYQGVRMLRGIPVNVWANVTKNNMVQEVYFMKQAPVSGKPSPNSLIVGMYFRNITASNLMKTSGQGQPQPGQGQPQPSQGPPGQGQPQPGQGQGSPGQGSGNRNGTQRNFHEKFLNIFNFHVGHPDPEVFDISPCYQGMTKRSLYLTFTTSGNYYEDVYGHKTIFFPLLRNSLANSANVSAIRIADIKVRQDDDNKDHIIVSFTLLDKAPIKGNVINLPSETSLEKAYQLIMKSSNHGIVFGVNYPKHPKIFIVHPYSMKLAVSSPVEASVPTAQGQWQVWGLGWSSSAPSSDSSLPLSSTNASTPKCPTRGTRQHCPETCRTISGLQFVRRSNGVMHPGLPGVIHFRVTVPFKKWSNVTYVTLGIILSRLRTDSCTIFFWGGWVPSRIRTHTLRVRHLITSPHSLSHHSFHQNGSLSSGIVRLAQKRTNELQSNSKTEKHNTQ